VRKEKKGDIHIGLCGTQKRKKGRASCHGIRLQAGYREKEEKRRQPYDFDMKIKKKKRKKEMTRHPDLYAAQEGELRSFYLSR